MKNKLVICISLAGILGGSQAIAGQPGRSSDSIGSEACHFAGNAVIASATTVLVDKFAPQVKRPALTGFIVSTSEILITESIQRMNHDKFSALDVVAGTLGAAAGAYLTDKWYIEPKVETAKKGTTYSVMVSRRF